MKREDLTIFEYRLGKEIKYTDIVKKERALKRTQKISYYAENIGYIDGYIYRPGNSKNEILPVIFNFHGGGMVLGYCEQDGEYCQLIADLVHAAVVNVDYPLAPEYKYPLPVEGTYSFLEQFMEDTSAYHISNTGISFMGHSAGGYLAASLCVMNAEKRKLNIRAMALNYPLLSQKEDPSERPAEDPSKAISLNRMQQYFHWYFNNPSEADELLASPGDADATFFPPTLINAASYDSLCAEETEFANKLHCANIETEFYLYQGCMHGFTHSCFDEYDAENASLSWEKTAAFLRRHV
ncbi:MAG: alpha/beta hydrolase [Solobacterium sp.]|nr:alpha/beta hydrolase [Solobacterium sp.]